MNGNAHLLVTQTALKVARLFGDSGLLWSPVPPPLWLDPASASVLQGLDLVSVQAKGYDDRKDVELVDVEGILGNLWRDDPHDGTVWPHDTASHSALGHNFTAFTHFIDIGKGPGLFDDFDGYSYSRGSASRNEFQTAADQYLGASEWANLVELASGDMKVDEAINYWLNDEYVHAPGQPWYRDCSPAIARYAFPADLGRYSSVESESLARFPLAEPTGAEGKGVPWSVFPPLDNAVRYWCEIARQSGTSEAFAAIAHLVEDASIPQHAAGYNGNWHTTYEDDLSSRIPVWIASAGFVDAACEKAQLWSTCDAPEPPAMTLADAACMPGWGWRPQSLATWVALQAYSAYVHVYDGFSGGYRFDDASARELTIDATAMAALLFLRSSGANLPEHAGHEHAHDHPHAIGDHHHHGHDHPHATGAAHHHPVPGEQEAPHHEHAHDHPHPEEEGHHHPHAHPHRPGDGHHHPY